MWFLMFQAILLSNVYSEDTFNNYEEEFDPFDDMILNSEQYTDDFIKENSEEIKLTQSNGKWICGDCTNIDEMKLIYNEVYNFDSTGYNNQETDIQMGLFLEEMRCVIVKTEYEGQVFRTAGTCSSEVTLRVLDSKQCDISVYG